MVEAGYEGIAISPSAPATRRSPSTRIPGSHSALSVLSWHQQITASGADRLGLSSYIERARNELGGEDLRWLVLTMIDDGNGIPARHALDPDIYSEPLASEEDVLAKALQPAAR